MANGPGVYVDYVVVGGRCLPLILRLPNFNPTGFAFSIELAWCGGSLNIPDGDLTVTYSDGAATITGELDGDQTAALPYGRLTDFKLNYVEPGGCMKTPLIGSIERK